MISIERLHLRLPLALILVFALNSLCIGDEAVYRKILDNGLVILAKESPAKDLVSINVTVKAGPSSEEEYTASGISHLVEHLVFKGTNIRKAGDIEKEMRSYGGLLNGAVSHDTTTYEITVPVKYLTQALSVLKDMLANAVFDKVELDKEREVVLKEIKLNEDDPEKKLSAKLFENAYIGHPYKYPPIGYDKILKSLTRDDLVRYYNRRYVPNNMVIAVVGGINANDAVRSVESEFGSFKEPSYRPVNRSEKEPPQTGVRVIEEEAPVALSYLAMGFHSTSLLSKDLFALDLLSIVLGRGNNSRLNKLLLKDKREVHSISAWNYTPMDPGLFVITAILNKDNIKSAKKDIMDEIKKLRSEDISDSELESAKRVVIADRVLSRESTDVQAGDLAESEALTGNSYFFDRYVAGVNKVSKYDIKRAAAQYLNEDNLTEVSLIPKETMTLPSVSVPKAYVEEKFIKRTLSNGLIVLLRANSNIPAVAITVAFSGGLISEKISDNGISSLTAKMLLDGTRDRKESDIINAVESRGGRINSFSGFNSFGLNVTTLKGDIDLALELIKDISTNSVFAQDELAKEKTLSVASIKEDDDDIFERGALALRKMLFKDHPYGMRDAGEEESVRAISRDDLIRYYQSHCIPNNMTIAISGDIDPEKLFKKVEALFGDFQRREIIKPPKSVLAEVAPDSRTIKMDKEQALLMLGARTVSMSDPDRYPLEALSGLLSGTSGKLFVALRERSGLAYTMGSMQKLGIDTGFMLFYAATTIDKLDEARKLLLGALSEIKQGLVTEDELAAAKKEIISSRKIAMETNAANSFQSALDELYGLGYDNLYKFENEINKVTKYDIIRAANKYLSVNSCAEVIIKPE
ncbi:MAG: pitrilysin family protein [Candidatus Omnitrophota bacterium]|nr:pitrilysin family protein [Candidatus Omnitrophota bacterium]